MSRKPDIWDLAAITAATVSETTGLGVRAIYLHPTDEDLARSVQEIPC